MTSCSIAIVGGGVIGSSVAYYLSTLGERSVIVVERDPSYEFASSTLSASSIRQQFTTPICIHMSRYGFEFLKDIDLHLAVDHEPVDVTLVEKGYLYLAKDNGAANLDLSVAIQKENGVAVERLNRLELSRRYSWLKTDDISCAALGLEGEGWFDGYTLLQAFRRKARSLGVVYCKDEVVSLQRQGARITGLTLKSGESIQADIVVNAAGPYAGKVAELANVGLPVAPERRCIFAFTCAQPPVDLPLVIDPSGLYFRPEGNMFIAGGPATKTINSNIFNLDVDYDQFDQFIWPMLANRVPAFESIRMKSAWAGHYEMNLFDQNAVIGWAPNCEGLMLATGFSGHGMQHSPAAGRGVAELILSGKFETLDLTELSFDRLIKNEPIQELNII